MQETSELTEISYYDTSDSLPKVALAKGERLQIGKIKIDGNIPNFLMVGNGTMNKHKIESINLIKEAMNCSKPAQFIIDKIIEGIDYYNNYHYEVRVKATTSTERQYMTLGYKELQEKGLAIRTKRGYYMLNPNALIPKDYPKAKKLWDKLVNQNQN